MITLTESEEKDLLSRYATYEIDEQEIVQTDWVSRQFASTGRVCRCVEKNDSIIIKQIRKILS